MTCVFIEQLEIQTVIGVFAWEKRIKQKLVIDLECDINECVAGDTDELVDALDYAAVAQSILDFAETTSFNLVETFAHKLLDRLLEQFNVDCVRIKVAKPGAIKQAKAVGVRMQRSRTQG